MPITRLYKTLVAVAAMMMAPAVSAQVCDCDDCFARVALKSNLAHDALLTPDLGIELAIARRYSLSLTGQYAWWSKDSSHKYWRIRGGSVEMRYWLGKKPRKRALTGHHVGLYGSFHDFDFEFGNKGWQSPKLTFGIGVAYGYSLRLNSRMNLDLGLRLGYTSGNVITYKPQCGVYVCTGQYHRKHFGLTGIDITLVWFPGARKKNNPTYRL